MPGLWVGNNRKGDRIKANEPADALLVRIIGVNPAGRKRVVGGIR
jgi:hypothetical protein